MKTKSHHITKFQGQSTENVPLPTLIHFTRAVIREQLKYIYRNTAPKLICFEWSQTTWLVVITELHFDWNSELKMQQIHNPRTALLTFSMGLSFNDLTNAPGSHCILCCQGEFVPSAAFQVLQTIWTLTGADRKTSPLLAVVLWVLQDVTWGKKGERGGRQKIYDS